MTRNRIDELNLSYRISAALREGRSTNDLYADSCRIDQLSSRYGTWYLWTLTPGNHINQFDYVLDGEISL